MGRLLLSIAILLASAVPALAKPPGTGMQWSKTWKEALAEAKLRNVPIHVAFHKDQCGGCTVMDGSVYPNKDVVAASKRWVNIYCNQDTEHGTKKVGNEEFCALIPGIKCEEHVAAWKQMNTLYFKGPIQTPTTIWCEVDGKEVGRQAGSMVAKEMISTFAAVEKTVGPGLNVDEYNSAMASIADGAKSEEAGKIPDAVKSYTAVVRMKSPAARNVIQLAQEAMNRLDAAGKVKVSAAKEIIAGRDYERAKSILKEVFTTYKGLPVAKEAETEYSDLVKREEMERKGGLRNPGSTR